MKLNKLTQRISTVILWLMFISAIFIFLAIFTDLNKVLVVPLVRNETPQPADVIIILGGGIVTDLKILPWGVQERVQRGVELYKQGFADKVIVTGGLVKNFGYSESEIMAPYAQLLGIAGDDLFEENRAESTYDNAIYSQEIMKKQGWQTALLATSDFHTKRACRVFEKLNFNITCVAAYKHAGFTGYAYRNLLDLRSIIREYLATVYYFVRGYI